VILAVCLNPALDITYRTDALRHGCSHPVSVIAERAGGKGINVARVLHQLQVSTMVTGLLGGARGAALEAELDAAGVRHAFSAVAGQSRRSVAVVDAVDATVFNEPGPAVSAAEWRHFVAGYQELLSTASAVTLSGSAPPGLGDGAYALLVKLARAAAVPVVLDTAGAALRQALLEGPTVVSPNRAEAAETLDHEIAGPTQLASAADELRAGGAQTSVISSGRDGLVCRTAGASWFARPASHVQGNPTGAGDALTAALAAGLASGQVWPDILRTGIGWAAGAAAAHYAGEVDEGVASKAAGEVVLEELG
jgi:tagatose 6-phosphate kinase